MNTTTTLTASTASKPNHTLQPGAGPGQGATRGALTGQRSERTILAALVIIPTLWILAFAPSAQATIAYGTLNNFDCVNDTGVEAHGFEIELDDVHSTDITYTYDYNHYGIPKI